MKIKNFTINILNLINLTIELLIIINKCINNNNSISIVKINQFLLINPLLFLNISSNK